MYFKARDTYTKNCSTMEKVYAKTTKEREAHSLRSNLDRSGLEKDIGEKGKGNRMASKVVGVRK